MKYFLLFCCMLLSINHSNSLCTLDVSNSEGQVYEYAPADTSVLTLIYDEGEVDVNFTLSLDSTLDQYFYLDGLSILVKDGVNITRRSPNFIQGDVICTDGSNAVPGGVLIVIENINSINPIQFPSTYNIDVPESTAVGEQIGNSPIEAEDEDASSWFYQIISETPEGYFSLVNPTTNGNLRLRLPLNYQENTEHQVVIMATSQGFNNEGGSLDQSATTTVTINIQDEDNLPPVFGPCTGSGDVCAPPLYQASVVPNEDNIITVDPPIQATDGDGGINDPVEYSFAYGTNSYDSYFEIDSTTAEITQIAQVPSTIYQFQIAIKAEEPSGKSAYTYLIINVSPPDNNPPTFDQPSYSGYISQANVDSGVLSYVTTDRNGRNPLQLLVSDAEDPDAVFVYEISSPFQVTSDGFVFYAATGAQYDIQTIQVRAININARLDSPTRESDPVEITIESYEVTTPEPTTQPETTEPETTPNPTTDSPTTVPETTPNPTTDSTTTVPETTPYPTTTSTTTVPETTPFTCPTETTFEPCPTCEPCPTIASTEACPTVATAEACPTVATTEACPTCSCTDASTVVEETVSTTGPSETTCEPCPTVVSTEACPTVGTPEACPTISTTDSCPTCFCADTFSTNPEVTTFDTSTCPTCPVCTEASTVEVVEETSSAKATSPTTTPTEENVTGVPVTGGIDEGLFYGLIGGLSGALVVAIIIIIYLACKKSGKGDDLEKNELLESDPSTPNSSSHHANPAFVQDTDEHDKVSLHSEVSSHHSAQPTSFSNPPVVQDEPEQDGGSVHNDDDDSYDAPLPVITSFGAPSPDVTDEPPHEEEDLQQAPDLDEDVQESPFSAEIRKGAAAVAAVTVAASAVQEASDNSNSTAPLISSAAIDDEEIQDYSSAYVKSQVIVEKILKDGGYSQTKLVTIQKYGLERQDTKAVVKILNSKDAPYSDTSSLEAQIRLLKKVSEQAHENILEFCGSHETDGELHCALMYAPQGNLQDYLQDKSNPPLEPYKLITIMSGIGRGLQYLHAKNVIHCHLQCKCTMLDNDLTPKITDFENNEVSSIKDNDDRVRWQAIEVLNGDLSSTASDVWSFGVVMWEVASRGMVPYSDVTDDEVKKFLEDNKRLEKPRGCSQNLFSIIESCWNADPRFRPDMYVLVSNLAEKLTEDANDLLGLDLNRPIGEQISPADVSVSIDVSSQQPIDGDADDDVTAF